MRRLLLLRHAKSDWPEGVADIDRPLNERGRRDAPAIGRTMTANEFVPDRVLVSPAMRTRQTWQLIAPLLPPGAEVRIEESLYAANAETLLQCIRTTPPAAETLLLIGHNPGLETLARSFAKSGDSDAIRRLHKKYPTAGLSVIELPVDRWQAASPPAGRLEMFVTPKSLGEN
jgi:phosphohistidine phosphatase